MLNKFAAENKLLTGYIHYSPETIGKGGSFLYKFNNEKVTC